MLLAQSLFVAVALVAAFEPARLERGSVEGIPYGAAAAGLVLVDVSVDGRGRVTDSRTIQDLAPFTDVVRRSVEGWEFRPSRENGVSTASRVLVAGLFRPAMLLFPAPESPTLPPPSAEADVALPTSIAVPPYPPNAIGSIAALVEVSLTEQGQVSDVRLVGDAPGFADAALSAARSWRFRPATLRGRPHPSRAYLIFVFRQPL